jgi:hypothetical protein
VEPQMRWTEHIHMLVQLLGFRHPHELFSGRTFADTLRSVWCFIASIVFESQEGFAAYMGTTSAMSSLQECPLMELHKKQRDMIGPARAQETLEAQRIGRGLSCDVEIPTCPPPSSMQPFHRWTPAAYGDVNLSAAEWDRFAVKDSFAGARSCGNHVCRKAVCHKGRLAKLGLCRLNYWSYQKQKNKKGDLVMKRSHGKALRARWSGKGVPPLHTLPPHRGNAQLERTHPFHFKMSPGVLLGPRCNHDLGVLVKLPVLQQDSEDAMVMEKQLQEVNVVVNEQASACTSAASACAHEGDGFPDPPLSPDMEHRAESDENLGKTLLDRVYYQHSGLSQDTLASLSDRLYASTDLGVHNAFVSSLDEMIEGIVAAEYYCVDYSSKD